MIPHFPANADTKRAARLRRWGLADVAPVFVETLGPLGWIGGQLLTIATPLLTTFVDAEQIDEWVHLLENPDQLEQLSQALDREDEQ